MTVVFSGRRAGVSGRPKPGDTFTWEETFDGIVPGSGPVAVTATIRGISPGEWTVTARPVARNGVRPPARHAAARDDPAADSRRELRPRRLTIPAGQRARLSTALVPFANVPGIIRSAWAALVFLGVLAGLGSRRLYSPVLVFRPARR